MSGYHTYADDELIDADDMNGLIRDQVVTIFSSTAARDAAITSPIAGQVCAVALPSGVTTVYKYDDSPAGWTQVGSDNPVTYAFLNETHTVTSSATPAADSLLQLTLAGSKTYAVDAWLITNADTSDTVNLRVTWAWTGTDALTGAGRWCAGPAPTIPSTDQANAVDLTVQQAFVAITDEVVYAAAVNGVSRVHDRVIVRTPASGGTLALSWAQGTSDTDPLHLYAPSHLRAEVLDGAGWVDPVIEG